MNLGRWQPDFVAISYSKKNIAFWPEVCRQSETLASENLFEACSRKLQAYKPIQTMLQKYTASGWTVQVLQWLVGTWGRLVSEQSLHNIDHTLKFLDVPHKQWSSSWSWYKSLAPHLLKVWLPCVCLSPSLSELSRLSVGNAAGTRQQQDSELDLA